jgi:alpha-tubulin suppressor-like RCC1 family protein
MHDATHMLLLVQELGKQKQEHQREMAGMRRLVGQTFKRCAQGTVHAVGNNELGCLGDGTETNHTRPVSVVDLGQRVTAVAAGGQHTMFLLGNGSVKAVGENYKGRLGDGTETDRIMPVSVVGLRQRVTAVAAGMYHSVFLLEDGSVKAVGRNDEGQLGDGTQTDRIRPVSVVGLGQRATAVAAGTCHTVFLLEDGSAKAVGLNRQCQLGDGTNITHSRPVSVVGLGQRATAVAAGANHTVFVLEDGSVKAVGENYDGRLGDGTNTNRIRPVSVVGLGQRVTAVAAGDGNTVFLLEDGSVKAVGENNQGQLGDGTDTNHSRPVSVVGLGQRVTAVAAGAYHTVFLLEDGSVKAVGANDCGALGDGTMIDCTIPVELRLPTSRPAVGICTGSNHSLVLQ